MVFQKGSNQPYIIYIHNYAHITEDCRFWQATESAQVKAPAEPNEAGPKMAKRGLIVV